MKLKLRISLDLRAVIIQGNLKTTNSTESDDVVVEVLETEHATITYDTKDLDDSERKWVGEHISPCKYEDDKTFLTIFTRNDQGHMQQLKFSNGTQDVITEELKAAIAADQAAKETFSEK